MDDYDYLDDAIRSGEYRYAACVAAVETVRLLARIADSLERLVPQTATQPADPLAALVPPPRARPTHLEDT